MDYIKGLRKLVGQIPLIMTGACVLLCENNSLLLQEEQIMDYGLCQVALWSLGKI